MAVVYYAQAGEGPRRARRPEVLQRLHRRRAGLPRSYRRRGIASALYRLIEVELGRRRCRLRQARNDRGYAETADAVDVLIYRANFRLLESVRAIYLLVASLTIRRSMRRIIARMMNPMWLRVRFS